MIKAAITILIAAGLNAAVEAQEAASPGKLPRCAGSPERELPLPDKMIRPRYPKEALNRGTGGTVELRVVVAPDGKTKELTPLVGDSEFSKSAVDAMRHWRFHPISQNGRSAETKYKVQVRFNPLLREANSDVELESSPPESPSLPSSINAPDQSSGENSPPDVRTWNDAPKGALPTGT